MKTECLEFTTASCFISMQTCQWSFLSQTHICLLWSTPTVYADDPADLCGKAETFSGMKRVWSCSCGSHCGLLQQCLCATVLVCRDGWTAERITHNKTWNLPLEGHEDVLKDNQTGTMMGTHFKSKGFIHEYVNLCWSSDQCCFLRLVDSSLASGLLVSSTCLYLFVHGSSVCVTFPVLFWQSLTVALSSCVPSCVFKASCCLLLCVLCLCSSFRYWIWQSVRAQQ